MGVVFNAFAWAFIFGCLGSIVGRLCDLLGYGLVAGLIVGSLIGIYSQD